MEWQDSVMTTAQIEGKAPFQEGEAPISFSVFRKMVVTQAEISFKAGIRKVVEWLESRDESTCMNCVTPYTFRTAEWQAFKKKALEGE